MDYKDKVMELMRKKTLSTEEIKKLEEIFPELAEFEDERIRKALIKYLDALDDDEIRYGVSFKDMRTWLEKQDEQKHTEWNREDEQNLNACLWYIPDEFLRRWLTDAIHTKYDKPTDKVESKFKDGDVLVNQNGEMPFIFKECENNHIYCYCGYTNSKDIFFDRFVDCEGKELHWLNLYHEHAYPATKEQRDLLFSKMKEAGYEWDAEHKQLRKIENEIEIPFGSKDSELQEATYYIPKGFHAEIEGDKVVIKKGEQKPVWSEEDEKMWSSALQDLQNIKDNNPIVNIAPEFNWLKSLKERYT